MPFICPKCKHIFNAKEKLEQHLKRLRPCVSEELEENSLSCKLCCNTFSNLTNLKRHSDRCIVKTNPELLLKHIEKQEKLLQEKNELLEQKQNEIKNIKKQLKAKTIPQNNIDQSIHDNNIDQSKQINVNSNVDNSTTNINIHLPLSEKPFAFRILDMEYLIYQYKNNNNEEFNKLLDVIYKHSKLGNVRKSIKAVMNKIHDNEDLKKGQNLRYCNDGKYKGKVIMYDYEDDEKQMGGWFEAPPNIVTKVISKELIQIIDILDTKNSQMRQI